MDKKNKCYGKYSEYGYEIWQIVGGEHKPILESGNSAYDQIDRLSLSKASLSLEAIKELCLVNCKALSKEKGLEFMSCDYDEDMFNDYNEMIGILEDE